MMKTSMIRREQEVEKGKRPLLCEERLFLSFNTCGVGNTNEKRGNIEDQRESIFPPGVMEWAPDRPGEGKRTLQKK